MGKSVDLNRRWVNPKGWPRPLAVVALVAAATVAVNPPSDAARAASGDFSIDFVAASPESYNHLTGGGAYDDRTVGVDKDIVESLQGGDYACGDVITYFTQVVVDDTQSADDDSPQTIEMDFSFLADTTGQSGVAIGDIVDVKVNYGIIEDLIPGENNVDGGISDDGGSVATLIAESLTGPLFQAGSELLGTVELTDLERNESIVVRIDVKLFCDPGSSPTGNLQGQLDSGRLTFIDGTAPVVPAQALSGGAQTIPFKQIGNIAVPEIHVIKTVTTQGGACPGVETLAVTTGDTVTYCYVVSEIGAEAPLYNVTLEDDAGTPGDTSDDFLVPLLGLTDVDGDGSADDLPISGSATGEASVTLAISGSVVNIATAGGDDAIIEPTTLVDTDDAQVTVTDPDFGSIVIVKNAVGGSKTFDFTGDWTGKLADATYSGGPFQITTAGAGATTTGSVTYTEVLPTSENESYTVAELAPAPPWAFASLICEDSVANGISSSPNTVAQQLTGTISLDPGETVICTFTNTRDSATLTVDKTWVNAAVGDAVQIAVDGEINDASGSSMADTANETDADVAGTTAYVGETVTLAETFTTGTAANYTSTLECEYGPNSTVIDVANGEIVIPDLAANETITCEFTNSRKSATLTLEKEWVDGEAGDTALLTIDGANDATATATGGNQVSTEKATATVYAGDTVALAEALTTPSGASYQSSLTCGGQTITASGTSGNYTVGSDPDNVTCRFTNTPDRGSITIIKDVTNTVDGFDSNVFDFTGTGGLGSFPLADNNVPGANTATFNNLLTGDYTITETDANANGFSLVDIDCGNADTVDVTDGVTINLGVDPVTCTFVNEAEGELTITKTAAANQPVSTGDNTFTVTYDVVVKNTGAGTTTYDLSDTPDFGIGASITAIDVALPGGAILAPPLAPTGGTIATGDSIAGGATETYSVTVTFDVAPTMTKTDRRCLADTPDRGAFNAASIAFPGGTDRDDDCADIPDPNVTVTKAVASGPTYDSVTDSYTISYAVVVTNSGSGPGTYDLVETPTFGAGTTITSVTFDGSTVALPIANPILDDQPIAAGGVDTYVVTIGFTVDASTTSTARDCTLLPGEGGTGTLNTVKVTPNIGDPVDGSDCRPIGNPDIEIIKTLSAGPVQAAPGSSTWMATYELQIDNNGTFGGSYDLTDDTGFATGLTVTDQQATSTDITINGDFNADVASTSIATGVAIAPGERDIVTVVVTFEYAAQVDSADRVCGETPGPGDATYNTATVTPNIGAASTDDACGPVPGPETSVEKTVSSGPTDNFDGTFTIVYSIDVTNAAIAGAGEYDLSDEATFSPGVTINSQAVANTAPGTIVTDATFPTSGTIVTGQTILPGATHTYEVTVVATLAVDTTATYVECSSTTGAAGEGLYNEVELTVDGETTTDDVCEDIAGDLMIEKSDDDVELLVGEFVEYQLKVTNVGGVSTGSPVIVTDVLPAEFQWVDFPNTAGELPFCTQSDQTLTCEIDATLVDAGGESTSFLVTAEVREGTAESVDGYENLSYVNSPGDPAPSNPVCEPTAISSASSEALRSEALSARFATPTNNVACAKTPVLPSVVIAIEPPTTPPTTAPPATTPPPATVPPEGLPRTGSDGSMNTLGLAALLLGLGVGLTLIVRRRQQQA